MDANTVTETAISNVPDVADWWHLLSPWQQWYYFHKAVIMTTGRGIIIAIITVALFLLASIVWILRGRPLLNVWVIILALTMFLLGMIVAWHIDRK